MSRESHLDFVVSSLTFLNCYVLNQLPANYQVNFDTKAFCDSISIVDADGDRIQKEDWPARPTLQSTHPSPPDSLEGVYADTLAHLNPLRDAEAQAWEDHVARFSRPIPVVRVTRARKEREGLVNEPGTMGGRPPIKAVSYKSICVLPLSYVLC